MSVIPSSTVSAPKVSTPPKPARRPPPPPKPQPFKSEHKNSPTTNVKEATPPKATPPKPTPPPKDSLSNKVDDHVTLSDSHVTPGSDVSPSVIAKIDHRPKMQTPDLERPRLPTPVTPPPPPTSSPPSSPTLRSLSPLRFSPPLLAAPLQLADQAMVISQEKQPPGTSYSEVTLKTLLRPPIPSELAKEGQNDDDVAYNVTTHVNTPSQFVPDHDYSSLQIVSSPPVLTATNRVYDTIEDSQEPVSPSPASGERGVAIKEGLPRSPISPVQKSVNLVKARSSSPKPTPPPKPSLTSSLSSRSTPGPVSPVMKVAPPPPPPRPASPAVREGDSNTVSVIKTGSPGVRHKPPVPATRPPPLRSKSPSPAPPSLDIKPDPPKQEQDSKQVDSSSHTCEVDIDAIISRSGGDVQKGAEPHTPPHKKGSATLPVATWVRPAPCHIYDDVVEFKSKPRANSVGDALDDEEGGKKPKDPPRRKAPPPPVPKGSPPMTHRPMLVPEPKNLTLGRSPRSDVELEALPIDGDKKKNSIGTPSPGIKSKFKTFFRGGSREDQFSGRSSFRKGKGKTDVVITSPTGSSKTLPPPTRPRGKTVDPYMERSGVISGYSYVTIGTDVREKGGREREREREGGREGEERGREGGRERGREGESLKLLFGHCTCMHVVYN